MRGCCNHAPICSHYSHGNCGFVYSFDACQIGVGVTGDPVQLPWRRVIICRKLASPSTGLYWLHMPPMIMPNGYLTSNNLIVKSQVFAIVKLGYGSWPWGEMFSSDITYYWTACQDCCRLPCPWPKRPSHSHKVRPPLHLHWIRHFSSVFLKRDIQT